MSAVVTPLPANELKKEQDELIQQQQLKEKINFLNFKIDKSLKGYPVITDDTLSEYSLPHILGYLKEKFEAEGKIWPGDGLQFSRFDITQISGNISYNTRYGDNGFDPFKNDVFGLVKLPSLAAMQNIHIYNLDPTFTPNFENTGHITSKRLEPFDLSVYMSSENSNNLSNIHAVFTVGSLKRYVYAVIGIDGIVYYPNTMMYVYANSVDNAVMTVKVFEKPIEFQGITKKKYTEDTSLLTKDLITVTLIKLIRNSRGRIGYNTINDLIQEMRRMLSSFFKDGWDTDSRGNNSIGGLSYALLINQSRVYRDGIIKVLSHSDHLAKEAYNDGINVGMKLFSSMARCGFTMEETTGKWVKDVKIIPWKCYYSEKLYEIKESYRKWKVTRLSIDPKNFQANELIVNAEGNHPNISSHVVCLGYDLKDKWHRIVDCDITTLDPEAIPYFFNQIEETLEIINFDSSYEQISTSLYDKGITTHSEDHSNATTFSGKTWIELD